MKAIVYTKYGTPEVLRIKDVSKPIPKKDEILIKVKATTVSPMDWKFRSGKVLIARLITGLFNPKNQILGVEFSGIVEQINGNAKHVNVGDAVFGRAKKGGAYAEYICVPESEIALNPKNTSFNETAGITFAATTALYNLRNIAKIKKGQKVLINGASGGVGTFAVQIAKYYNAEITAVCSGSNHDLVKELGADKVIDYTKDDFIKSKDKYDVIFDCVGKRKYTDCKKSLKSKGVYLSTVITSHLLVQMIVSSLFSSKKAKFVLTDLIPDDLLFLKKKYEEGIIKTIIDKVYSIDDIIKAHKYGEDEHTKGKVIVQI